MAKKNDKQTSSPEEDLAAEMLLKDADDALRQDRLQELWSEWGSTIIGMAFMIVFGTMIGTGWQNWRLSVHQDQTTKLIAAQSNPLIAVRDLDDHYSAIAKIIIAGSMPNDETTPELSGAMYNLLKDIENSGLPSEWNYLAQWAKLRTLVDSNVTENAGAVADQMIDLANKRNNPYASMIMAEAAIITAEKGDDKQTALSLLQQAKDKVAGSSDNSITSYIDSLIHLYKIEVQS